MIDLVTFFPFVRQSGEFTDADSMGSFAVHHDLAIWALSEGVADHVWILPDKVNVFSRDRPIETIQASLQSLPSGLRGKVSLRSSVSFARQAGRAHRLIALGKSSDFADLAMFRRRVPEPVPVCGIVHSCLFPGILGTYMNLLQMARRGDVLCVTSTAAMQATRALLDHASALLGASDSSVLGPFTERIRLVHTPLAIDDSWAEPIDRILARKILGYSPDRFIVLYFGRISREYKADLSPLLLAFRNLVLSRPDCTLIIAGSSIHSGVEEVLPLTLQQYGLSDHVVVHRNVAPAFKRLLFHGADVFVAPSDNVVESFGLSILEAMGAGLPVVASDWSGYRDLVQDGRTGFLVETVVPHGVWHDASMLAEFAVTPHTEYFVAKNTVVNVEQLAQRLGLLATQPELRRRLGLSGYRRVCESYLWSKAIQRFGAVWQESLVAADEEQAFNEPLLDLERVFGGYASSSWMDEAPRFVHPSSLVDERFLDGIPLDPQTRAILTTCSQAPRLLSQLAQSGEELRQRLFWLLKQGFLRLSPCAELPQTMHQPKAQAHPSHDR